MRACNCTLPYFNPGACKNCPNNQPEFSEFTYYEVYKSSKKRITKEYDENGKLKKEIIEDL